MKEVNSLSRQGVEEKHKKKMPTKKLMLQHSKELKADCRDREIFFRNNKSYGMIEFFRDRIKLGCHINRRRTKIS